MVFAISMLLSSTTSLYKIVLPMLATLWGEKPKWFKI